MTAFDEILDCQSSWCGWCGTCSDCSGNCSCPNLIAWDCITLDKTNPAQITISTECNPELVSTDGTVGITETLDPDDEHKIWDVSVACDDKKVGACAQDTTPWYLYNDKLRVDTSGPLTYTQVWCPGNAYVQIWFDESQLNITDLDQKVAVQEWCASWYLADRIIVGTWLTANVVWCKLKIDLNCSEDECTNPWRSAIVQTYLTNTINQSQATGNEKAYYFSTWAVTELDNLWWTHTTWARREDMAVWCITHSGGITTIGRWGRYAISFDWHQEQSHHVHGTRIGLAIVFPNGTVRLVQSRYSGVQWTATTSIGSWDAQYTIPNNTDTTANGWGWSTFSLWRWIERLPVWKHRRIALPTGTKIVPFYRVSTVMSWDLNASWTWVYSILWENESFVWWADWFTYGIDWIDRYCDARDWADTDACSC